jgi:uncharacterized protein (TIGR03435 family)
VKRTGICLGALVLLLAVFPARDLAQTAAAPQLVYSVTSMKPSNPENHANGFFSMPRGAVSDRFTARNMTLGGLLRAAYGIPLGAEDSRIAGAPAWTGSEEYDVDAKIDDEAVDALKKLSPEQRISAQQHMLQLLLADRCKLAAHRETRELAIYTLAVAKNGSKLQEAKPGEVYTSSFSGPGRLQSITAQASPMAGLVQRLEVALGRPVVDKTGLTGEYDCKVEWTAYDSAPPTTSGSGQNDPPSSIFTAMEEQLGLKLTPGKGPVAVIVIDRLERPDAN